MRVRIDEEMYDVDDAKEDVFLETKLVDILGAKAGDAARCMFANCIIRCRRSFPHRVVTAQVFKSVVLVFDTPTHAVRYILTSKAKREIDIHDRRKIGEPGPLTLLAPWGRNKLGKGHDREKKGGNHVRTGARRKEFDKYAKARIKAAVGAST
jgi:hypothetical protein